MRDSIGEQDPLQRARARLEDRRELEMAAAAGLADAGVGLGALLAGAVEVVLGGQEERAAVHGDVVNPPRSTVD